MMDFQIFPILVWLWAVVALVWVIRLSRLVSDLRDDIGEMAAEVARLSRKDRGELDE